MYPTRHSLIKVHGLSDIQPLTPSAFVRVSSIATYLFYAQNSFSSFHLIYYPVDLLIAHAIYFVLGEVVVCTEAYIH